MNLHIHNRVSAVSLAILVLACCLLISAIPNSVSAACPSVATTYGTTTSNLNAPLDGTYSIWTRMKASSSSNNSVWLKIDNGCYANVGDSSVSSTNWTWVNWQGGNTSNKLTQTLTAGNHSLKIVGREANVKVDRVILTTLSSCIPTGVGSNCAGSTTPPTAKKGGGSAQSDGSPVSYSSDGNVTSIDLSKGQSSDAPIDTNGTVSLNLGSESEDNSAMPIRIEVYAHGKIIASNDGSEIKLDTTKLRNGRYTLTIKAYYQSGLVKVYTRKINVKNKLGILKRFWYLITSPFYLINGIFVSD